MPLFDDPPLHDFPDRAIRRLQAEPANEILSLSTGNLFNLSAGADTVPEKEAWRRLGAELWSAVAQDTALDFRWRQTREASHASGSPIQSGVLGHRAP
jgi:hypothetical protein